MKKSVCHNCTDRWIDEDGNMCRATCDEYKEEQEENEDRRQKKMHENHIKFEIYDIHHTARRRMKHE